MRAPEITLTSEFGTFIVNFIKYNPWIKSVLEIGSGSGNGSTQCFIVALNNRKGANLICTEPNKEWFLDLVENTKDFSFVKCLNKSTISYDNFLIKTYDDFWNDEYNKYKNDPATHYNGGKAWYDQDAEYIKNTKLGEGVLEDDTEYDCVLIDGCVFTGYSEYLLLKNRTNCIILDDIFEYKTNKIHEELSKDENWSLVSQGNERNGWSCFLKNKK